MRIAVFGAGGAGGYFGARLAEAGHEVHILARGAHLDAILANGLQIESPNGDSVIRPAGATSDPAEIGPVDAVLLGVKTWQVPEAAEALVSLMGPDTAVLPLQNGVEAPDQLSAVLGAGHVLGGTARVISLIGGPGKIVHRGGTDLIELGELDNRVTDRVKTLAEALRSAGIRAEIPNHIQAAMWHKFIFICSISGVGAVSRVPFGELRSTPETRDLFIGATEEAAEIGLARGVPVSRDYVASLPEFLDGLPAAGTASMQRDMMAGRPSELESQNGALVRFADSLGLPAPIHRFLYAALLPLERRARDRG